MKAPKFTLEQIEDFTALFVAVDHVLDDHPRNIVFSMLGALLEKLIISEAEDHNAALTFVGGFTEFLVDGIDAHYAKEFKKHGDSGAKK
jgi:hypothetical protein